MAFSAAGYASSGGARLEELMTWRWRSRKVMPRHSRVLDVGCGNGFIAHHLSAMLGTDVTGIDLDESQAAIPG